MVHSQHRECVVIDGSRFCKSEITTPQDMGNVLIGFPLGLITWAIMGFCVAKIFEKFFNIDYDNPMVMIAAMLLPPMMVGVLILLFS